MEVGATDMIKREKILLVGSGGHAKTVVDTLERLGNYEIVGFVGPGEIDREVYRGYRLLGHDEDLPSLYTQGVRAAAFGMGYMGKSVTRKRLFNQLSEVGYNLPVVIDPSAVVATDAKLDAGTYVGKLAVINADVHVGCACIINTCSIVEHECNIGSFTHVAVGAVLCGQVQVGCECLIGANATIIQGRQVGNGSIIGAGAVVIKDVEAHMLMRPELKIRQKLFNLADKNR